jgi:hypothetical protein
MTDFPLTAALDDRASLLGLERHLHPDGLPCPRCRSTARRLCRAQGDVPAYRWRACAGDETRRPGTVVAKTRPRAAPLRRRRRGVATGEPTARLARELGLSRPPLPTLRQRRQPPGHATAPTPLRRRRGTRTPGKTRTPQRAPTAPPRRRAHQRQGPGTSAQERPASIRLIARATGAPRLGVGAHAHRQTGHARLTGHVSPGRPLRSPAAWQRARGSHPGQTTVSHGVREGAREAQGEGQRQVHGPTCEGAGAARRTDRRAVRGVHQPSLPL